VLAGRSALQGARLRVREGDCIVHVAEPSHTLRAGPEGLDVLAWDARAGRDLLPAAHRHGLRRPTVVRGPPEDSVENDAAAGPLEFPAPGPRRPTSCR